MALQPFNVFQRLIRGWESVHPYNAAQVLKLNGRPDAQAITRAWHQSLEAMGLGRIRAGAHAFEYEILNGDAVRFPVRLLPPHSCLAEHLSGALNAPFDDPREPPFRPFILPGDGSFHLGVVYRHWVADSVSIRALLRECCARLYEPALVSERAARVQQNGYWHLYGSHRAAAGIDRTVLNFLRGYTQFRTVRKACLSGAGDRPVRVLLREMPNDAIGRLRGRARARGATVGEALLAALAMAVHRHLPLQCRPHRRNIAVGNIVDLRPHAAVDLSGQFGMFLGFTHTVCRRGCLDDFTRALRAVSLQNRASRGAGVAQSSLAWMAAAHVAQKYGNPPDLYRFYRKEFPLAAGLSNVNLAGSWADGLHPRRVLDYIRVSPTGPMAPLALSTTTLGGRMSLAFTYRAAILNANEITELAQAVVDILLKFSEGPDVSPS